MVPVLGMHRSGTSLTTGILGALGVSLSEDLMPPTPANAIGYFESVGIRTIHDELLTALGSAWNASETFRPFPHEWWRSEVVAPFKEQLKRLVSDECARVPGVWGFKDPRTSRLLPLWTDIFSELNLEPRYVLVSRHPLDVVKSLEARDRMFPMYAELLWLEHTADAIRYAGADLRAIVDYSHWFENSNREAEYLIASLGLEVPPSNVLQDALGRLVSTDLRHHASQSDDFALPYTAEMYRGLLARDREALEQIIETFRVASTFGSTLVDFVLRNVVRG